jgi:succinyl-diaminopimelate desuccinylase
VTNEPPLDPVALAQDLIRCPSVTPLEAGALDLLEDVLGGLGFTCHRLVFEEEGSAPVDNLYARLGSEAPNFCFAGHSDVVPLGDLAAWSVDPFAAEIRGAHLIGRGAVDMKGAIAAFIAGLARFLQAKDGGFKGSISLLITGDEEDVAINGTRKVLAWLADRGEKLDLCLVGEPTSDQHLGDTVKIGRRGSMNGRLQVRGIQGHTAYPQLADNPLHHLVRMLSPLIDEPLDEGTEHFPPSNLQITSIDVGNKTTNVIPAMGSAAFNCRFNNLYSSAEIERWVRERLDREGASYDLTFQVSGEAFLSPPGLLSDLVSAAVTRVTGRQPALSTTGGTSDARFIKDHCPVAELGLLNATAHKVDEAVSLADLRTLTDIYREVLTSYFS